MTQDIKSNFDLEAYDVVDAKKKCFRFVGNSGGAAMSAAGEFIQDLYHRTGLFQPIQPHSDFAFCKTFSGLMVGLGIVRGDGQRFKDFKNIVELEGPETPEVPSEADDVDPSPTPPSASDKKKELPYQPAVKDDLLTGVYTPVKPGKVCRSVPQLTDFKVKVWESDGELVALAEAEVGKKPVLMSAPNRLAWYSKSRAYKIDLTPFGLKVKKCFRFVAQTQHGMSEAGRFVKDLYERLGKPKLKQPMTNIGFCRTPEGLMVGLGTDKRTDHLTSFHHAVFLRRTKTSVKPKERGGAVPPVLATFSDREKQRIFTPVTRSQLPSGTYKARKQGEGLTCRSIRSLSDFELKVWERDGQQVARVKAKVGEESIKMSKEYRLVWYDQSFTKKLDLDHYDLPDTAGQCFHFMADERRGAEAVGGFIRQLYNRTGKDVPKQPTKELVFCNAFRGLYAVIGMERSKNMVTDFTNIIRLSKPERKETPDKMDGLAVTPRTSSSSTKRKKEAVKEDVKVVKKQRVDSGKAKGAGHSSAAIVSPPTESDNSVRLTGPGRKENPGEMDALVVTPRTSSSSSKRKKEAVEEDVKVVKKQRVDSGKAKGAGHSSAAIASPPDALPADKLPQPSRGEASYPHSHMPRGKIPPFTQTVPSSDEASADNRKMVDEKERHAEPNFESRVPSWEILPDGDYVAFYRATRIDVGVTKSQKAGGRMVRLDLKNSKKLKKEFTGEARMLADGCLQLDLVDNWSLGFFSLRAFLEQNLFSPDWVRICPMPEAFWSLVLSPLHTDDDEDDNKTAESVALPLTKVTGAH
ncbi:hypothetical protein FOZ63_025385 [Perkinsus olseni]|uniref:Uncharacterized protein n=1 Tax=Perkinsus olseni TaxID=32597 RepID=A0A7J6SHC7_PEROL|nr:hypothetical protein FOZ63_025385 [Perkinsus olseni]